MEHKNLYAYGAPIGRTIEWGPSDLGISGVSLKATAATEYASGVIDVSNFLDFLVTVRSIETGGASAGAVKVTGTVYAQDGTTILVPETDLCTAIATATGGAGPITLVSAFSFGSGITGKATGGTLASNLELFRAMSKLKLKLVVATQSDAVTSCLGYVYLTGTR